MHVVGLIPSIINFKKKLIYNTIAHSHYSDKKEDSWLVHHTIILCEKMKEEHAYKHFEINCKIAQRNY